MNRSRHYRLLIGVAWIAFAGSAAAWAALPTHPILTEVFTDPPGDNDGPVARDPTNAHQEYIEIYLPSAEDLAAGLDKDALRLTFYEVEGDSSSSGTGLVNYRIDLPTFDLDPQNGLTSGAVARPTSGVVVLGWADYGGDPPTSLLGSPSTRVGLVNGGILAATDFVFIPINGAQFGGTTNFPVPQAISAIDMPSEAGSGIIQNGSAAYLLVNRDDPGYVQLYDDQDVPLGGSADPSLATGAVLGVSAMLDGFAANDDGNFEVALQPYAAPTGKNLDLETVLPAGGAFSRLTPQVPENGGNGYARRYADSVKTSEDGVVGNENPVTDAVNIYRTISNVGPFFPTPGRVVRADSPPELSVAAAAQTFDVLPETTGRPALACANIGGNFGITITAVAGASSNPSVATFGPGESATVSTGQSLAFPSIAATVPGAAVHGAIATAPVNVSAANTNVGDPSVVHGIAAATVTIRVLSPRAGQDAAGLPFQATAFAAIQGLPRRPGVQNEFVGTSLAQFVEAHSGGAADDALGNVDLLLNPATDLSDPDVVDAMELDLPDDAALFINVPSPAGRDDLVQTVLGSAEVLAGRTTYDNSLDGSRTAVRAIELNIAETATRGGAFAPSERVYFVDAEGRAGAVESGLSNATTTRGFELALLDSNIQASGALETGASDDFGVIVEVGRVRPGAEVVTGEFVFLSYTGGLEGADIDGLDVPPHMNETVITYLDLDPLDTVLSCETITRLFVVDGGGSGSVNIIETFSLNAASGCPCKGDVDLNGAVNAADIARFVLAVVNQEAPSSSLAACSADLDADGVLGVLDVPLMVTTVLSGNCRVGP